MKRTHSQSPTIKNEVGHEPLAKRVKQEGAGAAAALMPALVAVKQEMGGHSGQPAVHPSGVLPAQVPVGNEQGVVTLEQFAELRQLVQSQGKQLQSQSQQLQSQSNQIESQKSKINELEQTSIRIKQLPEGVYRGPLVNRRVIGGTAIGHGVFTYYKYDSRASYEGEFKDNNRHGQGTLKWKNGA